MPDHHHPENADVRELQKVKDDLLAAMSRMEERLVARIDYGFKVHEAEHEALNRRAAERHAAIDALLHEDEMDKAVNVGRVEIAILPIRILRAVNEFRVLILGTAAIVAWILHGGRITIGG